MACVRRSQPSLSRIAETWLFTVPSVTPSSQAICLLRRPRVISSRISTWRLESFAMPVAGEPVSRAAAQDGRSPSWSEVKCARYTKAWTDALARRGRGGLGQEFIDRHEAFLASGCTARADVCPRSAEELDLANVLVVLAMNAGTASTFLPFACR